MNPTLAIVRNDAPRNPAVARLRCNLTEYRRNQSEAPTARLRDMWRCLAANVESCIWELERS